MWFEICVILSGLNMMNLMISRLKMIFCRGVWNCVVLIEFLVMVERIILRSFGERMIIKMLKIGFMVWFMLFMMRVVISCKESNSLNCFGSMWV